MDQQTWGLIISIGLAILGALGLLIRRWIERLETRADKTEHDVAEHGHRIAKLEERTETDRTEISKLRDMRHEILAQCSRSISDFYNDSVKRISELKEWVSERIKK